jgi:hypothetical protein
MVGGGAEVRYGTEYGTLLYASRPDGVNKWAAAAKAHGRESAATISAYSIGLKCKAKGVKVSSKVVMNASDGRSNRPEAEARPSAKHVMSGGGASLGWEGPEGLLLTASYPQNSNTWYGKGKDHIKSASGFIEVYCIGLQVEDA